jgi:Xaa-Pro aminopeptidase
MAASATAPAQAATTAPNLTISPPPQTGGKLLVNRPRAYAVLEELKLDGLIAFNPINVYYLTRTWPLMTKFRTDIPAFATFSRNPQDPIFLVTGGAETFDFANAERELPEMITWSGAANWQNYVDATPAQMKVEPKASRGRGWQPLPTSKPTAREKTWLAAQEKYSSTAVAGPAWALAKALKAYGYDKKSRIAVDDMRVALMLQQIGMDGITFIPGENVFRKIRVVKTEPELELQRIAGRNNAEAAMAAAKACVKGMTYDEIEHRFLVECALRGNEVMEFLVGTVQGHFPNKVVTEGVAFGIDAVSHFRQYHGDFGRSIVVGEPPKDLIAREKAHMAGHDAIYSVLKAGMKISEVRKIVLDAEIKAGMPEQLVTCTPHGVGLEHGDNPGRMDVPFSIVEDIPLEENMVITIDMPYIEIGGHVGHHEDLIRITKTGYEPLHTPGAALVIV